MSALCSLQYAAGRIEACAESECPFWKNGGCAVERLGTSLENEPNFVDLLLRLRLELVREGGESPCSLFDRLTSL